MQINADSSVEFRLIKDVYNMQIGTICCFVRRLEHVSHCESSNDFLSDSHVLLSESG